MHTQEKKPLPEKRITKIIPFKDKKNFHKYLACVHPCGQWAAVYRLINTVTWFTSFVEENNTS